MAIDMEAVRAQQRELNIAADEMILIKHRMSRHREALDEAWKSAEIKGLDTAIEDVVRRLGRLSGDLEDLGRDVLITGEEIETEEGAAAAMTGEEIWR